MTIELGPPPRSRLRIAIGGAVVLVIVGLAATVLAAMLSPRGAVAEAFAGPRVVVTEGGAAADVLLVHVLGAVERPGVYALTSGARVLDAIAAAGGLTDDAEAAGANLARPVADAEQLIIPKVGEVLPAAAGAAAGVAGAGSGVQAGGRINLNTADAATLETLPGVGPSTSSRILRWREHNGAFRAIEDLLAVSGIGTKTFEALRDLVTV